MAMMAAVACQWSGMAMATASMSLSSSMLMGTAKLVSCFGESLKDDLFKEKLSVVSCKEIVRTAKDRKAGSLGYAEAMLIYYNKKSHNPLSFSQLYGRSKKKTKKENNEKTQEVENGGELDRNTVEDSSASF